MSRQAKKPSPMHAAQRRLAASSDPHVETVRRVCRYIEANLEAPLTLAVLGEQAALSPAHLQRLFKRITGVSPRQYADACRLALLENAAQRTEDGHHGDVRSGLWLQ